MSHLAQIVLLLAVAVAVVVAFQRLRIPTSLGYLLVGFILGPHTAGPWVDVPEFAVLAEFGVVFLLFSIGLNYSLPQLHAMRGEVLGLGTSQVALTAALVGIAAWLAGLSAAAAFVVGVVFAQSSTTIIGSQLIQQGEENEPHGRLGLALSVFQDVSAVPILVVIPVLGMADAVGSLPGALAWAVAKALLAVALVAWGGRRLLHPLFRLVAARPSQEAFTLAVLLVALVAAWATHSLGLSLAFGAFLAGMMLGDTEFRHQVESSIRPFRDVLLGLFFVGIGMLIDPAALPAIWPWTLLGTALLLASKTLVVAAIARLSGFAPATAWRTALLLAVGGEFGLALLALAADAGVVDARTGQIALTSVLLSMILGALLIRFNSRIAALVAGKAAETGRGLHGQAPPASAPQALIGGYGRVGHTIAVLLQASGVNFAAFDLDAERVEQGRADGHNVMFGDISDPELLAAVRAEQASLVIVCVDSHTAALRAVAALRRHCPLVPVIARAKDIESSSLLVDAGAVHAFPEAVEASLRLGATALRILEVPGEDIDAMLQDIRDLRYRPVMEEESGRSKDR